MKTKVIRIIVQRELNKSKLGTAIGAEDVYIFAYLPAPGLAVHKAYIDKDVRPTIPAVGWCVTHTQSGRLVTGTGFKKLKDALKFVDLIADSIDWTQSPEAINSMNNTLVCINSGGSEYKKGRVTIVHRDIEDLARFMSNGATDGELLEWFLKREE